MTKFSSMRVVCILGGLLAACSGSDDVQDVPPDAGQDAGPAMPSVPVDQSTDAGAMTPANPGSDAADSSIPSVPTTPGAIPLIEWVDLLVDEYTTDEALPDTVHDKNISDAEDSAYFEKYFAN